MKNKNTLIIFLFISIAIFIASYYVGQILRNWEGSFSEIEHEKMDYNPCDASKSSCVASYLNHKIKIIFQNKTPALKPFTVYVSADDNYISEVIVDFRMKNMDMGVNIINLKKADENNWAGQIILPFCSLGRQDWMVKLKIKSIEKNWYADFKFNKN